MPISTSEPINPNKRAHIKPLYWLAPIAILAALVGGFFAYQNYYSMPITGVTVNTDKKEYTQGNGRIIRFPEAWRSARRTDGSATVFVLPTYLLKKLQSAGKDELAFGAKSVDGSVSDNYYAISLDGSDAIRAVSKDEWVARTPYTRHIADGVYYG